MPYPYLNNSGTAPAYPVNTPMPAMPQYPQTQWAAPPQPAAMPYMIQVDGEMAARAWNMPANVAPGTVIPIWDVDGVHVYFKSLDSYGRLNPTRKARVVFEDMTQLPEGNSGNQQYSGGQSAYITKDDFEQFKEEIRHMMKENRQNGSNRQQNQGQQQRGGDNRE